MLLHQTDRRATRRDISRTLAAFCSPPWRAVGGRCSEREVSRERSRRSHPGQEAGRIEAEY